MMIVMISSLLGPFIALVGYCPSGKQQQGQVNLLLRALLATPPSWYCCQVSGDYYWVLLLVVRKLVVPPPLLPPPSFYSLVLAVRHRSIDVARVCCSDD